MIVFGELYGLYLYSSILGAVFQPQSILLALFHANSIPLPKLRDLMVSLLIDLNP